MTLLRDLLRACRLGDYRRRPFYGGSAIWIIYFVCPLLPASFARTAFNELQTHGFTSAFVTAALAMLAFEIGMLTLIWWGHQKYSRGYAAALAIARVNVVHAQVTGGASNAGKRTNDAADSTARLRDDPNDLLMFVDNAVDALGVLLFSVVAIAALVRIDALATVVAIVPLIGVAFVNRAIGHRVRAVRAVARQATAEVAAFLGAAVSASTTVRVAGAKPAVLRRFEQLGRTRAGASVSDLVLSESLFTISETFTRICLGLALIVAAAGTKSGRLTAGDIALFASYFSTLVWLPRRVAGIVIGHRRYQVSAQRLETLLPVATATRDSLIEHRVTPILGGAAVQRPEPRTRRPLECLAVVGLTVAHRGVHGVSFEVRSGRIAVLAGPVASGKSTVLHAVLGLLTIDSGTVSWNGDLIVDRAAFLVPPHCAYVPQTPTLFAESLLDNLLLGEDASPAAVAAAVELAAFDRDVASFPDGLHTRIGARGVRLSGGQLQRAAAARAFVRSTELLVIDDLTSALDVETEIALWERLRSNGATVLAASNRPAALERADVIVRLG